jgi:DNA-binding NarL/FixJ family response regulator
MQTGRDKPEPADTIREIQKSKQPQREKTSATILVIKGRSPARNKLSEVLERLTDLAVCYEAEQPAQALQIIEQCRIDLALVDISAANKPGLKLIEQIRMRYPQMPVLAVCAGRLPPGQRAPQSRTAMANTVGEGDADSIVDAIRYSQSLLQSGVSGFSVVSRI